MVNLQLKEGRKRKINKLEILAVYLRVGRGEELEAIHSSGK
jgi:hypothetical protein